MRYVFRLGKTTVKIREYLEVTDYIKRGDNKYP